MLAPVLMVQCSEMVSVPAFESISVTSVDEAGDASRGSIDAELDRLFIRQAGEFPIVLVLLFPVLVFVARNDVSHDRLAPWIALITGGLIARWVLGRRFRSQPLHGAQAWARTKLPGALWAFNGLSRRPPGLDRS